MSEPMSAAELPHNVPLSYWGTRLHDHFNSIFTSANAAALALFATHSNGSGPQEGVATMSGAVLGLTVDFPCPQLFRAAVLGEDLGPHQWLRLNPRPTFWEHDPRPGEIKGPLDPMRSTIEDAIKAQFILFFEGHADFIRELANHDRDKWEATWRFARVVRNAIGHGKINITDARFSPAEWCGVSFGPEQHGRQLFDQTFAAPDLILLLIDMDAALDRLGHEPAGDHFRIEPSNDP